MRPTFHAAKLSSPRLQRILAFLRQRGTVGATSLEIATECQTVCASTCIAELRAGGCSIHTIIERMTDSGATVFRYILLS